MLSYLRKWIRILLGFSARETNGFLILLPLVLIILFSEPIYRMIVINRGGDFSREQKELDSLVALWETPQKDSVFEKDVESTNSVVTVRDFNPNTAEVEELIALGFDKFLARRMVSYRQKGGVFRTRSDVLKIYGMDSSFYKKIRLHILLPEQVAVAKPLRQSNATFQSQKEPLVRFDINLADTTQLKSVYGIGTKLAVRITKFRDALGGFVKMSQLHEIYGLDSTVCERLASTARIDEEFVPKKINLNTANEQELSSHPYISRSLAKAVVAWRFQHGKFFRVDQIRDLRVVKESELERILPYLKVDE